MWAECQVQKKKNSKSYQRTLTYLYLQKLKCPKCKHDVEINIAKSYDEHGELYRCHICGFIFRYTEK